MRQEPKEFMMGCILRWPRPEYGFASSTLEGRPATVFIHRRDLCEHLASNLSRIRGTILYFYPRKVERVERGEPASGWAVTRAACRQCYEHAMQRRRQRAAILEARGLLDGVSFEIPGRPPWRFQRNMDRTDPAFQGAERAAAGRILARSSQEEIVAAASKEVRRILTSPDRGR